MTALSALSQRISPREVYDRACPRCDRRQVTRRTMLERERVGRVDEVTWEPEVRQ